MLNRIVWNRTIFDIGTVLMLNWIIWIRTVWLKWKACNRNIFLQLNCVSMLTELFEIE